MRSRDVPFDEHRMQRQQTENTYTSEDGNTDTHEMKDILKNYRNTIENQGQQLR